MDRHGQVIHQVICRDVTKLGNIWADFNEAMAAADPILIRIIYLTNRNFRASIWTRELLDPARIGLSAGCLESAGFALGRTPQLPRANPGWVIDVTVVIPTD
jgi:hypothetical protein